jgi:hypothetical protein
MAITMPAILTARTHEALMAYVENMADNGQDISANIAAGELVSEALRFYGFMARVERVKVEGHNRPES